MTPPRTLGVYKSLEDIEADFIMDLRERKPARFEDAFAALYGAHGISRPEAYSIVARWMNKHLGITDAAE